MKRHLGRAEVTAPQTQLYKLQKEAKGEKGEDGPTPGLMED